MTVAFNTKSENYKITRQKYSQADIYTCFFDNNKNIVYENKIIVMI